MQNVEFKAELKDLPLARSICVALGAAPVATLEQTDSYYRCAQGRLKKREVPGEPTEWIAYERPDVTQPRLSRFTIFTETDARARFQPHTLEPWVVVRKTRELLMYGTTRIHLDIVRDLGTFIEFEALVSSRQPAARGHEVVAELRRALAPALGESIAVGYSDLLRPDADERA
jgi:adenylate cyclase class IV